MFLLTTLEQCAPGIFTGKSVYSNICYSTGLPGKNGAKGNQGFGYPGEQGPPGPPGKDCCSFMLLFLSP